LLLDASNLVLEALYTFLLLFLRGELTILICAIPLRLCSMLANTVLRE
jgi:hypothetical protein